MAEASKDYYDVLTSDRMLQFFRQHKHGVVFARVGGHAFWPARIATREEWIKMHKHRQKPGQICVFFFGSNNFGWVTQANIQAYDKAPTSLAAKAKKSARKKSLPQSYHQGITQANELIETSAAEEAQQTSFFHNLLEEKDSHKLLCAECHQVNPQQPLQTCTKCRVQYHLACVSISKSTKDKLICDKCRPAPLKIETPAQVPDATPSPVDSIDESDEKCMICNLGGELVVCDFENCTKVYHRLCLGAFPFPNEENASSKWYCPRHTCPVTGTQETLSISSPRTCPTPVARARSPARTQSRERSLWKCLTCPTAVSEDVMTMKFYRSLRSLHPPEKQSLFSTKTRVFLCPNCSFPSPKVVLAKILERLWSTMATNRQGLPFYGPLLPGLSPSLSKKKSKEKDKSMNFLKMLIRIRALHYSSGDEFLLDIEQLVKDAKELIGTHSVPLLEAASTILHVISEQYHLQEAQIREAQDAIQAQSQYEPETTLEKRQVAAFNEWQVPWRKECSGFSGTVLMQVEKRTIEEWTDFITNVPLPVPAPLPSAPTRKRGRPSNENSDTSEDERLKKRHTSEKTDDTLSIVDRFDIAEALATLRSPLPPKHSASAYFLSPSTAEMEKMLARQSILLMKAIEGHTALRRAWETSQERLFEGPDNQILTLGEGKLVAELRAANNNLRARLKNKDGLVDNLTKEHRQMAQQLESTERRLQASQQEVERMTERLDKNREDRSKYVISPDRSRRSSSQPRRSNGRLSN